MVLSAPLKKKALVTGASGFVGGRLRDALLDAGADVVTLRRPSSPPTDRGRSFEADYTDASALERALAEEKPDYVFHVAGATKGVTYDDFRRANVMPTRNLLEATKRAHPAVERFVLVSSLASYGPSSASRPLVETDPQRPVEHYGESKREAEQVLARETDLPWTIIRPAGVYGPGDRDYFNLFREVERGRNVYFGNRHRWFSAVYVDDCVRSIVAAAGASSTIRKGYFVCDGVPLTWETFQAAIVAASGKRVREVDLPGFLVPLAAVGGEVLSRLDKKPRLFNRQKAKMGAQEAFTCRHDAAREDFGYRPEIDVREGVRRTLDWYRREGWL